MDNDSPPLSPHIDPLQCESGETRDLGGFHRTFYKNFEPSVEVDGVPHHVHPVPQHVYDFNRSDDSETFRGLRVPIVDGRQVIQDNLGWHCDIYNQRPGGLFITSTPLQWLALGSGNTDHLTQEQVATGNAHVHREARSRIRIMNLIRECQSTLPNGDVIRWRREAGNSLRVSCVEVGPSRLLRDYVLLSSQSDLATAIYNNHYTVAFLGREFPEMFTHNRLGEKTLLNRLANALEEALVRLPEISAFVPARYVLDRLEKIAERHLLDPSLYNTIDTFWSVFLEAPLHATVVPWVWARDTFGDQAVEVLEDRFMNRHPHLLRMLPVDRHTKRRVRQWIAGALPILERIRKCQDAPTAQCHQNELAMLKEKLCDRSSWSTTNNKYWVPKVFYAQQFEQVVMMFGQLPRIHKRERAPTTWWTAEMVSRVIAQLDVATLNELDAALLPVPLRVAWIRAHPPSSVESKGTYETFPAHLRCPETDEAAVLCANQHVESTYQVAKHHTIRMAEHVASYGRNDTMVIEPCFLKNPEVMKGLCQKPRLDVVYAAYDPSMHSMLDDLVLRHNHCDRVVLPAHRISDTLCRRAPIRFWRMFTPTVRKEREEEYYSYERKSRANYYSRDCCDDFDTLGMHESSAYAEMGFF